MRLQSFLSKSGIASRRKAADLIKEGHVRLNGSVVKEPGASIDPDKDKIQFKGKWVQPEKKFYYAFHKPKNVITTREDTHGRKTVMHFFKRVRVRLFPVGRLDRNSTGLLIMTNDGELANKLMHPREGVLKRYAVLLHAPLSDAQRIKFEKGVRIQGGKTAPAKIQYHGKTKDGFAYEVTLHEGKNRQIRRMMEILGHRVKALHRFEYGALKLGRLKPGEHRLLTPKELKDLLQ